MNTLWYDKEAVVWEDALPLGNGRIGAMVWSGANTETISLNEDSLWSGYPCTHDVPDSARHYHEARNLALSAKHHEAEALIESQILGHFSQSYLPLGELHLKMDSEGSVSEYRRSLDLETAISHLSFIQNGVRYSRECFVSAPDQIFVMKLHGSLSGRLNFEAKFSCELQSETVVKDNRIILDGIAPSEARPSYVESENPFVYEAEKGKQGIRFAAIVDFEVHGGTVTAKDNTLLVNEADYVIIRLCCRTSFSGALNLPESPYIDNCLNDISSALRKDYPKLLNQHAADYRKLFGRVDVYFGDAPELPLPERLVKWASAENDPALFALLFQYGRYLLISGSRPGTTPLNLQGIWNAQPRPPWSSNYTVNINTQMNYWGVESVNLSECHEPLIDFIDTLRITGGKTANIHYDADGFVVHHNTDLWGLSNPVGERGKGAALYAYWPLAGGWLSAHAFEHYLYTKDKMFLRDRAYPILRDAVRFFLDVLTEDADGTLIFAPSTSPENKFIYEGKPCAISKSTTMNTAIIKESMSNLIRCCEELEINPPILAETLAALKRLPEYKIGSRGELLEWDEEFEEFWPDHRHVSHLYPLYPGKEIIAGTAMAAACARSLELRGDESTGWSLAWRILLWARLREAENAFKFLKKQLRPMLNNDKNNTGPSESGGCYPNLFGAHPPFQIDSNFGACAGISEMLLQNGALGTNEIILLPALPEALGTGYVKGLRAKGGITVSIYFVRGKLDKAELTLDKHLEAAEFKVIYGEQSKTERLNSGIASLIYFQE